MSSVVPFVGLRNEAPGIASSSFGIPCFPLTATAWRPATVMSSPKTRRLSALGKGQYLKKITTTTGAGKTVANLLAFLSSMSERDEGDFQMGTTRSCDSLHQTVVIV